MVFVFFELLSEDGVLAREVVGKRQVIVTSSFVGLAFPFYRFFVAFYVFGEKVLATNFVEVPEMVDAFVWEEPDFVEGLVDELLLAPIDIPVVILGLPVVAA